MSLEYYHPRASPEKNKKLREFLYKKYGGKCCYCQKKLSLDATQKNYTTLEHVTPIHQCGSHHVSNLNISCGKCNSKRDNTIKLCRNREGKRQLLHCKIVQKISEFTDIGLGI